MAAPGNVVEVWHRGIGRAPLFKMSIFARSGRLGGYWILLGLARRLKLRRGPEVDIVTTTDVTQRGEGGEPR